MRKTLLKKKTTQETGSIQAANLLSTPILNPKIEAKSSKYSCTIKQFAYFIGATESQQTNIIKGQILPPEEPFFWYQSTFSALKESILNNDNTKIYETISRLKKRKFDAKEKQKINNRNLSVLALEKHLNFVLPLEFRELKKVQFTSDVKHYRLHGIDIKITPDLLFRANYKGQTIVGGVRINLKKTKPLSSLRMKAVSHILHKYIEKHVVKDGEVAMPEFCLCIDVFGTKYSPAPVKTDIPYIELKRACEEFINKWDFI